MPTGRIEIGISFGSNLGDREAAFRSAVQQLGTFPEWSWSAGSSIYETDPVGVPERFQERAYYNAMVLGLLPEEELIGFAEELHRIEATMGRIRGPEQNAPRPLDLDLIFAGTLVVESPTLMVPHPRWAERRFVVEPLAEIRPDLRLPGRDQTVAAILSDLPARPGVRRLAIPGWPPPASGRQL